MNNRPLPPLFTAKGICKHYAVAVLRDVDLAIHGGEIHALMGANGAGKSTLSKIIAGMVQASKGVMSLAGNAYAPRDKVAAERSGVQIVHQELSRIPTLTVAENLWFGSWPTRWGVINRTELHRRTRDALSKFGLDHLTPDQLIDGLGIGTQQMLEVAAALLRPCRVLILDEPTAALSIAETERLMEWLRVLRTQGVGILYISHRMEEIRRLADKVTILRDGVVVHSSSLENIASDQMMQAMAGPDVLSKETEHRSCQDKSQTVLRVEDLSDGHKLLDISLSLWRGERLGIAGLVGSGRTELLETIFGARRSEHGLITVANQEPRRLFRNPAEAVAAGLALVPEDRKKQGLLLSLSVRINVTLSCLRRRFCRFGILSQGREQKAVAQICDKLQTRYSGIEQSLDRLSGGNQQKIVLAKWLMQDAEIFLLDEPTRGVDVAARQRIYQLLEELVAAGKGIMTVSSDLDELMAISDRIVVMSNGRLTDCMERGEWTRQRITEAMFAGFGESP